MPEPTANRSPALLLPRPRLGDVIDCRYGVDAILGGGMPSVFRATHLVLDEPVALLKIMGDEPSPTPTPEKEGSLFEDRR